MIKADPLTRLLVRVFVDGEDGGPARPATAERRTRLSLLEGYTSVVLNTVLFAIKLAIGLMSGSVALLADAVHTAADSLTSAVVIVSAYVSRRPPDSRHPFGYGRIESISAVVIAVLLGVAAFEFGKASVLRLAEPGDVEASWLSIAVIAGTLLVKLWMSLFARSLGRSSGSAMLEADAWHHATDVLATVPVIAAMIAGRYGYERVDGFMGILVALVIAWAAWDLAKETTRPLLGEPPTAEEIAEIESLAMAEEGVRGVHDIVVHKYGHIRVISLHIETPGRLSALSLHALAERVEARVGQGNHGEVVVHVDPVDRSHPDYDAVLQIVEDLVRDDGRLQSFHDLRVSGTVPDLEVTADIAVNETLPDDQQAAIHEALARLLDARFPGARLRVSFDPTFAYRPPEDP